VASRPQKFFSLAATTEKTAEKRATCFATLLQNELESDIARFTTHVQACIATNQVKLSEY